MRKITLLAAIFMVCSTTFAATGWFNDFLTIKVNGTETANNYYIGSDPATGAVALQGKAFGTVTSLEITGCDMKYWADGGDNRTGGAFYYKITDAANKVNLIEPVEVIWDHAAIGGNDYQGTKTLNINLMAGLPYGTYQLHVWAKSWGTAGADSWLSNNSANYVATFTKAAPEQALAGTYKVGSQLTADFISLSAAVSAINANGISNNVVLEITSDITEPANFGLKNNTEFRITIRPDADANRTISFTQVADNGASSGNFILGLPNINDWTSLGICKNVTIDGYAANGSTRRLIFLNLSTIANTCKPIHIIGSIDHINIKNCILTDNTSGSSAFGVVSIRIRNSDNVDYIPNNICIDNCVITSNSSSAAGIFISNSGTPVGRPVGLEFKNNKIEVKHRAISLNYSGTCIVSNNELKVNQTTSGMASFAIGGTSAGLVNTTISNNRIIQLGTANTVGGANGIRGIQASGGGTWNIYNNYITGFSTPATGTTEALGIRTGSASNVYNNTIVLNNITTTGTGTSPIACIVNYATTCNLANNILITQEDDIASYCIYQSGTLTTSDYNILYRTGTVNAKIGYAGSARATLSDWQTGSTKDANSKSVNVEFANAPTGDLSIAGTSIQDDNLKVPRLTEVLKDIFGTDRPEWTYAGAHQSTPFITTEIETPTVDSRIMRTPTGIRIELDSQSTVEIYTINGMLIEKTSTQGTYSRDLNKGVYIIRINGKSTKFIK